MKIEFQKNDVLKALHRVSTVAEKKTTRPILGNVLLDANKNQLTVAATDLEIGIHSSTPVEVLTEGKICTPVYHLTEIIKQLPDSKVTLQKEENEWMVLKSGKAQFRIAGVPAEEFPQMSSEKEFSFSKVRVSMLLDGIEKTHFAMSTDEMRHNLNGVLIEIKNENGKSFCMVATDGHRLAMFNMPLTKEEDVELQKSVILPRKGVMELRRLLAENSEDVVDIALTPSNAAFRLSGTLIYMKLVVGDFPDYTAVIPKTNKKKLMVNRQLLSESLKRVSLLSDGKSKAVKFSVKPSGLHLGANSPELGEAQEDLPGEFDGGELEIGFNAKYFLEALAALKGDQVAIELDTDQSPGLIRTSNESGCFSVIMPMRI